MDFDSLEILNLGLFNNFNQRVDFDVKLAIMKAQEFNMPVDYFKFYKSVSSVYSSKIEGEKIDFDSYFKHKFLNVEFKVDYTQKADDLFDAYEFIEDKAISLENVKKAHSIISRNLLPISQQGKIRLNPMYVVNDDDKIEYVAADSHLLAQELEKLFNDIEILQSQKLSINEVFYFASLIHLVFVKFHPFQDGNGRTARLLEKWFLYQKIGSEATGIQLEKNYFKNLGKYYFNLKSLRIEYANLDYSKALDFLLMTVLGLKAQVATK